MSTPPGDYPPPNDPNQPQDPNQGGYGQYPPPGGGQYGQGGGYGQYPPQGGPGGYQQQPPNHPKAMTSLIVGILGVVCCSIAAPFAWVIGKKSVAEIDASGGAYGGRGLAQAGYILGIVGTVLLVLGLVFFLIAIAVGGFSFEAGTNVN